MTRKTNRWRPCPSPHLLALAGCITLLAYGAAGEAIADPVPGLGVKALVLCSDVRDREPDGRLEDGATVNASPVYVWTTITGTRETLRELRKHDLLPIRHEWVHVGDLQVANAGSVRQFVGEPIKVGGIKLINELFAEVAHRGAFDWRTWSLKRNLLSGTYIVRVVYKDGSPVRDLDGEECRISFRFGGGR